MKCKSSPTVLIVLVIFIVSVIYAFEAPDDTRVGQFDGNVRIALTELMRSQPRTQFIRSGPAVNCIFGAAFEHGSSPEQTAETFIQKYTGVFGAKYDELTPGSRTDNQLRTQSIMYDEFTDSYKFTLVYFSQSVDGIPVFRSELRLLVRNESDYPLVLAKSSLRDLSRYAGRGARAMSAADIAFIVRADNMYLEEISEPQTVIWAGLQADTTTPRAAVTVYASNDDPSIWLYVVDAETGDVLFKEDQIIMAQVQGDIAGNASEDPGADICQEELPVPIPYALVDIGGESFYTDSYGHYDADVDIGMITEVTSGLAGTHFTVHNSHGDDAVLFQATPGGEVDFLHNETNDDPHVRAQVNAYVAANRIRDFVLKQNPVYPGVYVNNCSEIFVNRNDEYCPCNAWYTGAGEHTLNFCESGFYTGLLITCPNTAFAQVLFHEYGHHLVQMAGSGQWQYGEGMADAVSMLLIDDPHLGIGFYGDCDEYLRSADNEIQFPCVETVDNLGPHYCGQVLSGAIWDVRNELALTYPSSYLDTLSRLTVNSILLHIGYYIEPQIVIDFLTLDDDDTDITNGTPHMSEICTGFSTHNLRCPEFSLFEFVYSEDIPEFIGPDVDYSIQVEIIPRGDNDLVPGTAAFYFAINGFDYQQGSMTQVSGNVFEIDFPEASCGDMINWYVTAQSDIHGPAFSPGEYEARPHKIIIAKERLLIFADDFNENKGWEGEGITNWGGSWERAIPATGEDVYGSPQADYDGSGYCFLTEDGPGNTGLQYGLTTLTSPNLGVLDGPARIEYAKWWNNLTAGVWPFPDDPFQLQVSGDNGNTWQLVQEFDPYYSDHLGGWFMGDFVIDDFVTPTTGARVRFDAINYETFPMNLVEAAIDDVRIYMYVCYDGLAIITQMLPEASLGSPYVAQLEAIYADGEVTWSDKFGDLSGTGLTMSSTGLISGTPTTTGQITLTVVASDMSDQTEKVFTLILNSGLKLIDNFSDEWTFGCIYKEHFIVEGGTPPYEFTNPSNNFAEEIWLGFTIDKFDDFDPDGVSREDWGVYGDFNYPDSFWFTVAVEDAAGATDTLAVTIYTNDSLRITTVTLPDGVAGVPYSAQIEYTGGTHPIKWYDSFRDIMNLGLWLDTLTGEVSGIPDSVGTFELRINVHDTSGCIWRFEQNHVIGLTIDPQNKCGDFDLNGAIDITDLVFLADYMFAGGPAPDPFEAADVNNSGSVDISDVTYMAAYMFAGGGQPHCPPIPD